MEHQIKTFEDACTALGLNPVFCLPAVSEETENREAIIGFAKMTIIAKALNEGWTPNWNATNQHKYMPWFDMGTYNDSRENDGFSFFNVSCIFDCTCVSSRLCFKSRELAEYAATQFLDIYKAFMVI